jgi:hypothetical protein
VAAVFAKSTDARDGGATGADSGSGDSDAGEPGGTDLPQPNATTSGCALGGSTEAPSAGLLAALAVFVATLRMRKKRS